MWPDGAAGEEVRLDRQEVVERLAIEGLEVGPSEDGYDLFRSFYADIRI